MLPVRWLAAESGGVDLGVLAQYGVLGVFAILLILFARISYKRETDRSDRLEAEVKRLNDLIQEKAIPALMSATGAVEESAAMMRAMQIREREVLALRRHRDDGEL